MTKRTVYVFHINILFDDCVNKLDLDEPPAREKKKQVLFRGVSKDNPHNAIVVINAEERVICKDIYDNFDNFKKNWRKYEYGCPQ